MLYSCCRCRRSLSTVAAVHPKVGSSIEQIPKTFPVEFKSNSIPQITHFKRHNVSVLSALSVANLSVSEDHSKMLNIRKVNDNSRWMDHLNESDNPPHLINQSGVDLADQFIVKYPRSFTIRFSEKMNSNQTVPRGVVEDLCANQNCSDAWKLYENSKRKGIEISIEDEHRLLDLFCYHGYENKIEKTFCETKIHKDNEDRELEQTYTSPFYLPYLYKLVEEKSIWHEECPASAVLQSITEQGCHTEFTYCAAIQSMVKFNKENLAWKLYEDMRDKGFKPNTATYSALMCGLSRKDDLWDNNEIVFDLMKDMMSEPVVKPDADFFYHMLNNGEDVSFETAPAEVLKKCNIVDELRISNIDIEFPTVASIIQLLIDTSSFVAVALKLLDWMLVEEQHRLIPSFIDSQQEDMLCVLARKLASKYLYKYQILLLEYIENKKLMNYFGTFYITERNINRLAFLAIGKSNASGYNVSKVLYYNIILKYELSIESQLNKLISLIKAAILNKQYEELVPLYEECMKLFDSNRFELFEAGDPLHKILFSRVSNFVLLGIRDSYLRRHIESAHQMRELAHRTFSDITSHDFVPNATALLVIVVVNLYTGHYKDAFDLMDTLYQKYNIVVPNNVILGSLRLFISRGGHIIGEPAEWSELSPGTREYLKLMIMDMDYNDFNYTRNWAAIHTIVKNIDFGED